MTDSDSMPNSCPFPAVKHEIPSLLPDKIKVKCYRSKNRVSKNFTLLRNFSLSYVRGIDKTDDRF